MIHQKAHKHVQGIILSPNLNDYSEYRIENSKPCQGLDKRPEKSQDSISVTTFELIYCKIKNQGPVLPYSLYILNNDARTKVQITQLKYAKSYVTLYIINLLSL